ncbi:unnamed protein product [Cercopithifilaria johnstoni]|uniref:Uncharacterized protein n=1 Tax=Cercopithifilaria johnstoni TaxID=2874296 RepID=A0A8J2MAT0_9BILA|nr:unnamed protein product [Cercopithifilaria johnstoni]
MASINIHHYFADVKIQFIYTTVAQELAAAARGNPTVSYRRQISDAGCAFTDHITVSVVTLRHALVPMRPADDELEFFQ